MDSLIVYGGFKMLDPIYMNGVDKYIDSPHYTVWKFPADKDAEVKQKRPIVYSYSLMSRGYGNWFVDNNFIDHFIKQGFDVYLVDWGTAELFTLSGWSEDDLLNVIEVEIIDRLLKEYKVDKVNVFAVCIGGLLFSALFEKSKAEIAKKIHRLSYYGVPIMGARELGMQKVFAGYYKMMAPFKEMEPFKSSGISLFFLDILLLKAGSSAMTTWSWQQFYKQNKNNSFMKIVGFTSDDRWVPFRAFLDLLSHGVTPESMNHQFHIDGAEDIHFLNVVGVNDMLVKPSSSIIEYGSPVPREFKSFKQMIIDAGHFMFCSPCYTDEKVEIAQWFAGNSLPSLLHKIKDGISVKGADTMIKNYLVSGYGKGTANEQQHLIDDLNSIVKAKTAIKDIALLAEKSAKIIATTEDSALIDYVLKNVVPLVDKSCHR